MAMNPLLSAQFKTERGSAGDDGGSLDWLQIGPRLPCFHASSAAVAAGADAGFTLFHRAPMNRPDLRDPEQWVPRELFAAYCGERSNALLTYYDKAKTKRKPIVWSFDWLAFLVLPAWLGYRRQWTLWATLIGAVAVITVIAAVAKIELPAGAFGGALIALGLMARGLLLTSANGLYAKLKQHGLDDAAIRSNLAGRARPSPGLALVALLGAFIVQGLVVALLPE